MSHKRLVGLVALLFWTATPSLFAQDFLKQLEEKLLQKQSSQKKDDPAKDAAGQPQPSTPDSNPKESGTNAEKSGLGSDSAKTPPPLVIGDPNGGEEMLPPPKPTPRPRRKPSTPLMDKPAPAIETAEPNPRAPIANPGYLGMTVESITGGGFGLNVVAVTQNSPAWKAGFQPGDKVVGVNGAAVTSVDSFAESLSLLPASSAVKFLVDRKGRNINLTAILMDRDLATKINGPLASSIPYQPAMLDGQAFFGVNVSDMSPAFRTQFAIPAYRGASVTDVTRDSPADLAGLRPGDCIIGFNGKEVQSANEIMEAVMNSSPGAVVAVSFYRGMVLRQASVVLARADGLELPTLSREITQEMLTADYVAELHSELDRLNTELRDAQQRMQEMEARLRQLERQR
ncbi:MAG: PDZ domain-containing protein [Pirellula sp.]|jgi:membrane-associated protease RseP (regulator of RpoE activity)|nr:PDZ domain-containing protein [Pirellula sp.]